MIYRRVIEIHFFPPPARPVLGRVSTGKRGKPYTFDISIRFFFHLPFSHAVTFFGPTHDDDDTDVEYCEFLHDVRYTHVVVVIALKWNVLKIITVIDTRSCPRDSRYSRRPS